MLFLFQKDVDTSKINEYIKIEKASGKGELP
jgi:hypothetical protein